jgi:hypothetical protein
MILKNVVLYIMEFIWVVIRVAMNKELIKVIAERQLVSVMNQTKWRELCQEFS